jgi:hypothetical protein
MLGNIVMFTPKGFEVKLRVSRMAVRSASGDGCVRAVRMPVLYVSNKWNEEVNAANLDRQLPTLLLRVWEPRPCQLH